jgi:hypothetical protein
MPLHRYTANANHPLHSTYRSGHSASSAAQMNAPLESLLSQNLTTAIGLVLLPHPRAAVTSPHHSRKRMSAVHEKLLVIQPELLYSGGNSFASVSRRPCARALPFTLLCYYVCRTAQTTPPAMKMRGHRTSFPRTRWLMPSARATDSKYGQSTVGVCCSCRESSLNRCIAGSPMVKSYKGKSAVALQEGLE